MMEFDEIMVKESPGLCRCCLSEGCYKDLASEYTWMNETEIYAEMLLECFDISISQHNDGPNGPNRLICEVCITRLRDACNFKKQVTDSEKKFVDMIGRGEFGQKVVIYQTMKAEVMGEEAQTEEGEVEYLDEEMQFDDTDDQPLRPPTDDVPEPSGSETITIATHKVKGKRGRPKKTAMKPEKKVKVAKIEPKTSKVAKDGITDNPSKTEANFNLKETLTLIIQNSSAIPFRWAFNKYMCFYCWMDFIDSSKLKEHNKIEHENPTLNNVLNNLTKNARVKLDISEMACKKCLKPTKDLTDFITHLGTHDVKIYKCDTRSIHCFKLSDDIMSCLDCGQTFRFFGTMLKHANKYHNKISPFLCEICGQGFLRKIKAESHKRNVHSNIAGRCNKCGEVFASIYALQTHKDKVHRSEKLKCPMCPEILGSRYLKLSHLAKVHDAKNVQFSCDECNVIFTHKSRLLNHKLRVHQKEKTVTCDICGFKVFSQAYLKVHKVKHNEDRPFECQYCKKTFQRKKTLQYHERIHTDDRRYSCKECGKAFVQVSSLKAHIKSHHVVSPAV